jgi:lysozyme family protein
MGRAASLSGRPVKGGLTVPASAFEASLPFVLRWEGGYVNHPADPGGATNRGITQRVYDGWRARQAQAPRDVKLIEDAEVHAIYERDYWLPPRCDQLPASLDLVQFDTAVNMGVGRAVRFLQSAVGCGVDGAFGDGTARAVAACDPGSAITGYCDAREAYYRALAERKPELGVFLKGWLNRVNALRTAVGLPGFEAVVQLDFGAPGYIARVPDLGVDTSYDF